MVVQLPPELIERIVEAIPILEKKSKRLFANLHLNLDSDGVLSALAVSQRLDDFPRHAEYCTTCRVLLSKNPDTWATEQPVVDRILRQLTSLRTLIVMNYFANSARIFNATVIRGLLDIVLQPDRKLEHIMFSNTAITLPVLARSLGAAPQLTFHNVDVVSDEDGHATPPLTRPLTRLGISGSQMVSTAIVDPAFEPYLKGVCQLIQSNITTQGHLAPLFSLASTLQQLHCYFSNHSEEVLSLPTSLPHLRKLIFGVESYNLPVVLMRLMANGGLPSLEDLKVHLSVAYTTPERLEQRITAQSGLYAEFDSTLAGHPALKVVTWSLFLQHSLSETERAETELLQTLRNLLPKTCARGLLLVGGKS
ncbi:hypothetical protein MIND_00513700 [Mycena indigotica]|uniref:Uncharacterized protein n=1 Tax=Mycena indigotica TaxID=2126181 RepID=A0A8H6W8Q8_9AGAR|nr:uncharacterized protein MIND_00513700 [Mycena indigotica]KAF7307201.1 hypothetical protein MIND_00513700 [Mycena indigotica]